MNDDESKEQPDDQTAGESEQSAEEPNEGEQATEQSDEQSPEETDQPEQQSDDQPAEQSEEQPADSDQQTEQSDEHPAEDQPSDQAEEQPTDSDQPAEQAEEQPADSDQQTEQSDEQPAEDQPSDQAEEQPADSDQPATGASADDTLTFAGGAAAPAGGGGSGATKVSTRNLKVIAEFTQDGQKFIGDILIHVFESDNGQQGRLLFQTDGQYWQDTNKKGNVITTPMLRVGTSEVLIFAHARVALPSAGYQTMDTQDLKFPMPSGDTLRVKFDVGIGELDNKVNAPDANAAIAKVSQSPQLKGHLVLAPGLDAQPAGNQQFRVTGKFLSGDISLL